MLPLIFDYQHEQTAIGSLRVAISNGVYVIGDEVELRCHEDLREQLLLTSTFCLFSLKV